MPKNPYANQYSKKYGFDRPEPPDADLERIQKTRELIGDAVKGLSDAEVLRVARCCEFWAICIFDWWMRNKKGE